MLKYLLYWLPLIIVAFSNAMLRETVLLKFMNEFRAHQWSTLTLIIFCSVYTWFVFPKLQIVNSGQAFTVGILWVILTVIFEFALGRMTKKSWSYLLENYNLMEGKLWPVFLICLFLLPFICYRLKST